VREIAKRTLGDRVFWSDHLPIHSGHNTDFQAMLSTFVDWFSFTYVRDAVISAASSYALTAFVSHGGVKVPILQRIFTQMITDRCLREQWPVFFRRNHHLPPALIADLSAGAAAPPLPTPPPNYDEAYKEENIYATRK
jgi:hypothetical protein